MQGFACPRIYMYALLPQKKEVRKYVCTRTIRTRFIGYYLNTVVNSYICILYRVIYSKEMQHGNACSRKIWGKTINIAFMKTSYLL